MNKQITLASSSWSISLGADLRARLDALDQLLLADRVGVFDRAVVETWQIRREGFMHGEEMRGY